jgi:hypothetical protein
MNAQVAHNTRQERLARVSDISKLTTAARDQAFGIRVTGRRFTGMEAYSRLEYGSVSGRVGYDRKLDVESKSQRIPCAVEACDKVFIMADVRSRSRMTTEGIVEECLQSLNSGGRGAIQFSGADRSVKIGDQRDRDVCGSAHAQS